MTDVSTTPLTPRPLTPLIGRDSELESLLALLRNNSRLLTVTGIGGVGKTRLAHQAALELEPEFIAGVMLVPLAEIGNPSQIPAEIARQLGSNVPDIDVAAVASLLGGDPRLLLLDNLEQIPDAGATILDLLQHLPNLAVLATSQIPLNIPGEQLFPLQPMAVSETGEDSPAVKLFLHRLKAVDPLRKLDEEDVHTISEICRILDGIPLAIELAAARLSIFSLPELRDRLGKQLEVLSSGSSTASENRHRTMRNAISWSYDLLDSDQRRLFRYLGVYSGGMSLEAITHTLDTLEITGEPLDAVSFLVGRGLIRPMQTTDKQPRYQMLQTLREFALEQLDAAGDVSRAQLAHAKWVADLTEIASPLLASADQANWYSELDTNRQNIHAAMEWATNHRPDIAARIVGANWREFDYRGVSRRYIELGHKAVLGTMPENVRARCWMGIGMMETLLREDMDTARESLGQALVLSKSAEDDYCQVRALSGIGIAEMTLENYETALGFFQEAATLAERTDDVSGLSSARANIGAIASYQGKHDLALDTYLQVLRDAELLNQTSIVGVTCTNLGMVQNLRGEYRSAQRYLARALDIALDQGNVSIQLYALMNLGESHMATKEYDIAISYLEQGTKLAASHGILSNEMELRSAHMLALMEQGALSEAINMARHVLVRTTNQMLPDATISCVGVVMLGCIARGDRRSAALLAAPLLTPIFTTHEIHENLTSAARELIDSMPIEDGNEDRLAYEAGKSISFDTMVSKATELADKFLMDAGVEIPVITVTPSKVSLTSRELETLTLASQGMTNSEIAEEMFVSVRTVTTHLSNIYTKLDAKNRSMAVATARQTNLLADH